MTQDRRNCVQMVLYRQTWVYPFMHSPTLRKPLDMLELSPLSTVLTGVIVNLKTSHALLSGEVV